jgi:hypothetical protein
MSTLNAHLLNYSQHVNNVPQLVDCNSRPAVYMYIHHLHDNIYQCMYRSSNSTGTSVTHVIADSSHEAHLISTGLMISQYGCQIVLYTHSKYLCNMFCTYVPRWTTLSDVKHSTHQVIIRQLISSGACNINYVYMEYRKLHRLF